ncbi:FAD-binding oxidoreductase [Candidatus Purcelliella pentastirinorum]|uniref:FAD-binding oxidoreductase n=1 Tax=Candidatus Purcelliella pentastirinorum TaxID=472834 RepID=UPI002367F19D|nr:FAD-binding oxidoreductase [Candidatus Purcelliella pentastirinorum]WDI79105.1 FAD-binding oxidoreductase [Candidatus Purcelliella pentastirinorum]WDR80244.1 FAD-binding oxidoreductase [Candidatus Purcelliella pentastirinorum]
MTTWVKGKIIKILHWNNRLFSIILNAHINNFIAGQFTKLAIQDNKKKIIQRAYSYVNSPNNKNLEFYIVKINNGYLTTKLQTLKIKDEILISKNAIGNFTIKNIPSCKTLWMFATGTAIGPYLSILQTKKQLTKFENIVLVHAVRKYEDFNYIKLIQNLQNKKINKLHYVKITSREINKNTINGHIPTLIKKGIIEKYVNLEINKNSQIMLCGNPGMVKDTQKFLIDKRKLRKRFNNKEGEITTELYW